MDLQALLARTWYGNTVRDWALAVLAFLVTAVVLVLIRRVLDRRWGRVTGKTSTGADDLLVDVVRRTRWYFIAFVAFEVATRVVMLPPRLDHVIDLAVTVIVLLQLAVWANGAISFWVRRVLDRRRAEADLSSVTTITAVGYVGRGMVWLMVLAMALNAFGFNVTALVTGLGVGGIALALAVQNILSDLFGAVAIVLDKPFVVGDFIIVDTTMGSVEHIGLKTTRLRSLSGEQVVVSNADLLGSRIHNYKRMFERRVAFNIDLAYDTPPDAVASVPKKIAELIAAQKPVRFDRSHFGAYADSALRIETVYYILAPEYNVYMDIQQSINLQLLAWLNEKGIRLAFPGRDVFMRAAGEAGG